ncbi:hypothetical protein Q7P37_010948 [Cladosporium fusiforme]
MRSAIIAAAFAVGAIAVPLQERALVYETDIVYATQYVTVTQGDVAATQAPAPTTTAAEKKHFHGHRKSKSKNDYAWTSSWATTWTESAPAASSPAEQQEAPPAYSEPAAPSSYDEPEPTSTKAKSSSAPASTGSSSGAKPSGYQGHVVHHHNIHRANHSAPDLKWSDSLAATAQKIGESCNYAHDTEMDGGGYGQNIAAGVKADNVSAVITELFYNGEVGLFEGQYGKDSPDMSNFHEWGHFSQIVWVGTTEVGCATVDCSSQGLGNTGGNVPLTSPSATTSNYANEYADNVKESRGDATCYWNDGE